MLVLKNISKAFPQRGVVLDHLNLDIQEGDTISVAGPSGSGKTTLLNIIGLLDKPDTGEILFRGQPLNELDRNEAADYRNHNVGFVFQDHLLLPYLTVYENILLPLLAKKLTQKEYSEKEDHAMILIKNIGILSLCDKYPENISGGEAQRTALVRALVNKPSLLLADEPTGALDKENSETLGNLLIELNRQYGISVLLATHSEGLAGKMTQKYKLDGGRLSAY